MLPLSVRYISEKVNFLLYFMLIFLYSSEFVYAYVEYIETREVTLYPKNSLNKHCTVLKTGCIPFFLK